MDYCQEISGQDLIELRKEYKRVNSFIYKIIRIFRKLGGKK